MAALPAEHDRGSNARSFPYSGSDHDTGAGVELDKVLGRRASDFLVGDPRVVAPCQAFEKLATVGNDGIGRNLIAIAIRNRTMRAQIGNDGWVAIVRSNVALVVNAVLQVVEAGHSDVEMRLSACWVATARTLIVHTHDHLAASRSCQQKTVSATEEIIAGGGRSVH